jgi:hypothetical protein
MNLLVQALFTSPAGPANAYVFPNFTCGGGGAFLIHNRTSGRQDELSTVLHYHDDLQNLPTEEPSDR